MGERIYQKLRRHLAEQVLESITEPDNNAYYIVLARTKPFDATIDGGTDASPPDPEKTDHFLQHTFFEDFISGKKVTSGNASLAVKRYNWNSGTVFQEYDQTINDIYETNFYVLTEDNNVYKCLFNNKGSASTIKPTGTSTSAFTTSDGYTWKYMTTLTSSQQEKFLTQNFMPVNFLAADDGSAQFDVQAAAVDGAINTIDIIAGGSDYRAYNTGTVTQVVNSTAVQIATTANNTSKDFYTGSAFYTKGGTGAGQLKKIIEYIASSRTVVVNSDFSPALSATVSPTQYKIGPLVIITSPDGSGALAISDVSATGNTISNVTVITAGSGYGRANAVVIANSVHGSGAQLKVLIPPAGGHGNNIVSELGADKIILHTTFVGSESNTTPTGTSFRKIVVMKDPVFANGSVANSSSPTNIQYTTRLEHTSGVGFSLNEMVAGAASKAEGRVVAANATHTSLNGVDGTFSVGEQLVGNTSVSFQPIVSEVNSSDMINRSGDLLYVQTVRPVTRAAGQTEDIKIILDF
jgi:hypothetical protein